MIQLQYFDGGKWDTVSEWNMEFMAWLSLGDDDLNYRTVDTRTNKILTDKSVLPKIGD